MRKLLQSWFSGMEKPPGYDLDSKSLLISPAMCAPNRLCSCNPGWSLGCLGEVSLCSTPVSMQMQLNFSQTMVHTCQDCNQNVSILICSGFPFCLLHLHTLWKGTGATCEKCPADSFSDEYSSKKCKPCPPGSKAMAGATSVHSCACDVGVLYNTNGSWKLFRTAFSSQVLTVVMKQLIWKAC